MDAFRVIIASGLSGAGKSHAINCFEDMGYVCVDNMPSPLVPKFVELSAQSKSKAVGVALGMDIREHEIAANFRELYDGLKNDGYSVEVLFLEASDETLVRRFSETRRPHPLDKDSPLMEVIREERELMRPVRELADRTVDTSAMTAHNLRDELERLYEPSGEGKRLTLSVMSFGFKHGVPYDADLMFDVRFLPNPHFVPELKPLTGLDGPVSDFVMNNNDTDTFMGKLCGLFDFLLPLYRREGKSYLTVAVGCTGGRHRSVAVAESLAEKLKQRGQDVLVRHRDKDRQ
jgi:UPF0042 nucleotide-binding protein